MAKNLSVFFGAGAEVGYGLPAGGRFALEIFRRPLDVERALFRQMRSAVNARSSYAAHWLPKHYADKRISVFGRQDKVTIFESSLEYRNADIRARLEDFDGLARRLLAALGIQEADVSSLFETVTGRRIGEETYVHEVELNERLGATSDLFSSSYFSAVLDVLKANPGAARLRKLVRATLQLYVGAAGQALVAAVNDQVFQKAPEDISVFDDLSGIFRIDFLQAGLGAFEVVLEETTPTFDLKQPPLAVFESLAFRVLEDVMASCLDYQALVDGTFRYLYSPVEWAKFTKICTFLLSVRGYIAEAEAHALAALATGDGYYHDLAKAKTAGDIGDLHAATANYTALFDAVMSGSGHAVRARRLNGSTADFYDPYTNRISSVAPSEIASQGRFLVPFMFTQSGIKPLTSVEISRRYVDFYDRMAASEAVAIVGYGFGGDDGHINGMFRSILEDHGIPIYVCQHVPEAAAFDEARTRQDVSRRMRCESDKLRVVPTLGSRSTISGAPWLSQITV